MPKKFRNTLIILAISVVPVLWFSTHRTKSPVTIPKQPLYIALGDSIAAGNGLETASDSSACDRTNESYPYIVAKTLDFKLVDLACGGATINSGILGIQTVNKLALEPQLDRLLAYSKPQYISLTIGANDIDWTDVLTKCAIDKCGDESDTASISNLLTELSQNLDTIIAKIKTAYKHNLPTVVLTGYYDLFPAKSSTCNAIPGIDSTEQQWWNLELSKLNLTIYTATTNYESIKYIQPNFNGHDVCSDSSWLQNLQQKAPFHPTDEGQKSIANSVTQALKNQ